MKWTLFQATRSQNYIFIEKENPFGARVFIFVPNSMIIRLTTFIIFLLLGSLLLEQICFFCLTGEVIELNDANPTEADVSADVKVKDSYANISLLEDALHAAYLGICASIFSPNYRFISSDGRQALTYGTIFSPPPNLRS